MRLGFVDVSRLPSADDEGDLLPWEPTFAGKCPIIMTERDELNAFLIHGDFIGRHSRNYTDLLLGGCRN